MAEYMSLQSTSPLNVIVGKFQNGVSTSGVIIYHPADHSSPSPTMDAKEMERLLTDRPMISLHYDAVREVVVDHESVWRNKNEMDFSLLGIPREQNYMGRGKVILRVRQIPGIEEHVTNKLAHFPYFTIV